MNKFVLLCRGCGKEINHTDFVESMNKATNGMLQIRAECPFCKAWIKWIPYAESVLVKDILNRWYNENC